MPTYAISTTRELIHGLIAPTATVPIYRWLPLHLEELPCYVVGRPDGDERSGARGIAEFDVPVYALGRTLRDDDAQAELDQITDQLISMLWKPSPTEGVSVRLSRWRATVVTVAETEVPAYTLTVVAATAYC